MLVVSLPDVGMADDFLYVLATPPGQRSEIHWVPANAPTSARVLIEDLDRSELIHRHRDELWWVTADGPVVGDLVGQTEEGLGSFGDERISDVVRQTNILYWSTATQLGSFNIETGEKQVLTTSNTQDSDAGIGAGFIGVNPLEETTGFRGLALHEDRLYFGDGSTVNSVLLDGSDRQLLGARDPGMVTGAVISFSFLIGSPPIITRLGRLGPRGLAVHDDHLLWVKEGAFWQLDLNTGDESPLGGLLPGPVQAMAVTDEAIYWIDDRTMWRWKHGTGEHEALYEIGDTTFDGISVVTADPRPSTIIHKERIEVMAETGETYQLLISEDLQSWSPDVVRRSLFNEFGLLSWLRPKTGTGTSPLVWTPKLFTREAYFAAWRYDVGSPYDEDSDGLPDYWEKRHFTDLSVHPDGDTNGDGLTHLDEARLFIDPITVDSDGDGLSDAEEVAYEPPLNPAASDTDGDSLTDGDELSVYHTDPHLSDTDSDGFTDGFELSVGSNPIESDAIPVRDTVLADFADDLMLHLDFESSEDGVVINHGQLGGRGRIVGQESYVARETEAGDMSRALDLSPDSDDPLAVSYLETEFSLEDLGFAVNRPEITIALWLRTESDQWSTFLSAGRNESSRQAVSFQVGSETQDSMQSLRISLKGSSWSTTSTFRDVMQTRTWTHLVWTYGPSGRKIYIDGNLHSKRGGTNRPFESDPKLRLGGLPAQFLSGPFTGAMDDVRIYRRVLPKHAIDLLAR